MPFLKVDYRMYFLDQATPAFKRCCAGSDCRGRRQSLQDG